MARRTQTYAVRLAVEGGGRVKAELVSVGQSGEQSLKRIEAGGDKASRGLKGLGRQADQQPKTTFSRFMTVSSRRVVAQISASWRQNTMGCRDRRVGSSLPSYGD